MAYDFQGGTQQILYGSPSYLDDLSALTFAAWVQRDSVGGDGDISRIFSKDEKKIISFSASIFAFQVSTSSTGHAKNSAVNSFPDAPNTWVHLAATWDGTLTNGGSALYKDGSLSTPYSTDIAGSGSVSSDASGDFAISNRSSGTLNRGIDGRVAEVAVWNVNLTAGEVNSLSKGFRPSRVRPQSLVFYARYLRTANDIRNGSSPTVSGVAAAGYHPRVI